MTGQGALLVCIPDPIHRRMETTAVAEGLEGIVVTRTRTSLVDGAKGRLVIAGQDVESLARTTGFEAAIGALWGGEAPTAQLAEGRQRAFALLPDLGRALSEPDAMAALRGAVAQLPEAFAEQPGWIVGALGVFAAAHARARAGQAAIAPNPKNTHSADVLAMIGANSDAAHARALDAYLVTVMDHGLNASTFTARVVASTGSDLVSAIAGAIGALKGPLHGGAPGPVLDMLDAIGAPDRAEAWLTGEVVAKRRIMGMGHRIYRVRDPRAAVLEAATLELEQSGVRTDRLALARAVEHAAHDILSAKYPDRNLCANVEFYTAVLLDALGIPRSEFSAMFAVGRVAGWCAHFAEQRKEGRLIRPESLYVGPMPE
jgi:citrate synthase